MKQALLDQRVVPVFNIQKCCIHDGNGMRTTVFLKGCRMTCSWCSNPESQRAEPELLFYEDKCKHCGKCLGVCKEHAIDVLDGRLAQDHELCVGCGKCVEQCHFEARKVLGSYMTEDEVFDAVNKDKVFYKLSGGGVTFSGGEPLLYSRFLQKFAQRCHEEGYTVYAETCGCFPSEYVDLIGESIDKLLFDLKIMDTEAHRQYCGVTNTKVLSNFRQLCEKTEIQPRFPLIPGVNDSEENILDICRFLRECPAEFHMIHILPYHNLGASKYTALGREYQLEDIEPLMPGSEIIDWVRRTFETEGFQVKIGG